MTRHVRRLALFAFLAALLAVAGCRGANELQRAADAGVVKNIILVIGDGFHLEHERAYNRYLSGSYASGLRHWTYEYRGTAATWDVTTYNRYARAAGVPGIGDSRFDPFAAAFDARHGYDVARGGPLPYPESPLAAVRSLAALAYFGARLKAGTEGQAVIPATDSASAATALATGFKTDDGNLSWRSGDLPDGALKTIAEMLRAQKGGAIGVVSTVPFTHATPAAFVSHSVWRGNYQTIGSEIVRRTKPDVVIGGGHPDHVSVTGTPDYTWIAADDHAWLKAAPEYVLAERRAGIDGGRLLLDRAAVAADAGKKLFGLFGGAGGHFEFHSPSDDGTAAMTRGAIENPSLAQAATAALTVLSRNRHGFFLMVEQGDIDWANHANDFRSMIGGMWDLDQAVRAIEAFVDRPGDDVDWTNTAIIVTADHANGFMRIDATRPLGKGRLPRQLPARSNLMGLTWAYPGAEITYGPDGTGVNSHTNEPVTVYAKAPPAVLAMLKSWEGAWYPGSRLLDNTQLFQVMLKALGLADENRK